MNSQRLPDWKHSTCEGYFFAHSARGMVVQARTNLYVSMVQSISVLLLYILGKSRIIVPLSGTMSTPYLLTACSYTQLLQRKEATPPAEVPVMVMLVAENRLYFQLRKAKWANVLLLPLKYRLVSLYQIGRRREPVWTEPSQQGKKTLFHVWKGFMVESGVRNAKLSKDLLSGYFLLLPKLVRDRLQQYSMVSARPSPRQRPPLQKKMRNLSVQVPAWKQRAAGEPSRHLADGSLDRKRVKFCVWTRMARASSRQRGFIYRFTTKKEQQSLLQYKKVKDPLVLMMQCGLIIDSSIDPPGD